MAAELGAQLILPDGAAINLGLWNDWWQLNWEPSLSCQMERRIGVPGEGGKWICDPHRLASKAQSAEGCLIYSIGSMNDWHFEEGVYAEISNECEVHTFDCTIIPSAVKPAFVHFHPWCLKGKIKLLPKYNRTMSTYDLGLAAIRQELGHTDRTVDILKIDCEGCEFYSPEFAAEVFLPSRPRNRSGLPFVPVRQVLMEVHEGSSRADRLLQAATKSGFAMFHKEPNIRRSNGGKLVEISLLKMSPHFFGRPQGPHSLGSGHSHLKIMDHQ